MIFVKIYIMIVFGDRMNEIEINRILSIMSHNTKKIQIHLRVYSLIIDKNMK